MCTVQKSDVQAAGILPVRNCEMYCMCVCVGVGGGGCVCVCVWGGGGCVPSEYVCACDSLHCKNDCYIVEFKCYLLTASRLIVLFCLFLQALRPDITAMVDWA